VSSEHRRPASWSSHRACLFGYVIPHPCQGAGAGTCASPPPRVRCEVHAYCIIIQVYACGPRVKTKLTITIDEHLVPRTKRYARSRGLSLSQLIENALRDMGAGQTNTFSRRWRGTFRPAARDCGRYRARAEKHI
jgi:hypothetical protein